MASFAYPTIFQSCEILPKRIKFHEASQEIEVKLLLKFECISEDEVEVPISDGHKIMILFEIKIISQFLFGYFN